MSSIIQGMKNEDYHADPAVGKSGLDKINKSIAHYLMPQKYELNIENWPMSAAEIGTAVHSEVLEGALDREYAIAPTCKKQSAKDKATWAEYYDYLRHHRLKRITQEAYDKVKEMDKSVKDHPIAGNLFNDGRGVAEISLFWKEKGLPCKCRPDWIVPDETPVRNRIIIADLKTAESGRPEVFQKVIMKRRYHVQAGWYCHGVMKTLEPQAVEWMFVVVENKPPYNVSIYVISDENIKKGFDEGMKDLMALKEYYDTPEAGRWAGYPPVVQEIALPEL